MKIYSIKEIVKATHNIYNSKPKASKKINLSPENESTITEAEKSITLQKNLQNEEKVLVLKKEISTANDSKIDPPNYKITIKPELPKKADIIINSVGGSFGIKEYPYNMELWKKSLNLNILKHILINNYFLKRMIKNKFGRILFFSTTAVDDPKTSITYSTSKAFLENYVKKSAVIFGKYDRLTGVSSNIMMGQKIHAGTNNCEILLDEEKLMDLLEDEGEEEREREKRKRYLNRIESFSDFLFFLVQ